MKFNILPTEKQKHIADKLMGDETGFTMDNRIFNLGCIITSIFLILFLIINAAEGLWASFWLTAVIAHFQALVYYFARFHKKFMVGIVITAVVSYLGVAFNYYINSGINGPTIYLFFLTACLLFAATPNRLHIYWVLLHIIIGAGLIITDLNNPGLIQNSYNNDFERYIDTLVTCLVTFLFIFFITRYLRNHYLREKVKAEGSQIRLKAFFESTENCYILLNNKSGIIYFNSASARFTQLVNNKSLHEGDNMETFVSYAYIHRFRENYQNALAGIRCTEEKLLQYEGLGKIWWQFSFAPVFNALGNISGVSFTSVNITNRKEHAEKIKQRNKSLVKIAFLQSHELRQPVSSILGLLNLIKEDGTQTDEYLQYLDDAVEELGNKLNVIEVQTNQASGID